MLWNYFSKDDRWLVSRRRSFFNFFHKIWIHLTLKWFDGLHPSWSISTTKPSQIANGYGLFTVRETLEIVFDFFMFFFPPTSPRSLRDHPSGRFFSFRAAHSSNEHRQDRIIRSPLNGPPTQNCPALHRSVHLVRGSTADLICSCHSHRRPPATLLEHKPWQLNFN